MTLRASGIEVRLNGAPIIGGISLELRRGEILGIIGPNGAGKSTLLRALAGLIPCSHGAVLMGENPLPSLRARARAAVIAVVLQEGVPSLDLSVRDLVLMGRYAHRRRFSRPRAADHHAVEVALESVGAEDFIERPLASLSGGERQLAHIARALAQSPEALLLDEPTSALDIHHQLRVFGVLRAQADAGAAVGIVLHDLNEASRRCDRIAVVDRGALRAIGTPYEVLTPELLADVYRVEAHVHADEFGHAHVHPLGIRAVARMPERLS